MRRKFEIRPIVLTLMVLGVILGNDRSSAWADTILSYTGNPFKDAANPLSGLPPSYSTADRVTVTLGLSGPLAANLSMFDVRDQVLNWTIADGLNTFSSSCLADSYYSESDFINIPNAHGCFLFTNFSTDSNGVITEWRIHANYYTQSRNYQIETSWTIGGQLADLAIMQYLGPSCPTGGCDDRASVAYSPGTWTPAANPVVYNEPDRGGLKVPEPSSLALLVLGFAGFWIFGRRRVQC